MLTQIRKFSSSLVVKVLFIVLISSFVIWGIADVFRPGQGNDWAARVGSHEISKRDFEADYQAAVRRLQSALGADFDPATARSLGVAQSVIGQMINRALLTLEAEHLGLHASDAELKETLMQDPRLRDQQGQLDVARFRDFLQRLGRTQDAFFAELRKDIDAQALIGTVEDGVFLPEASRSLIAQHFAEARRIEYVEIKYDDMPSAAEPSESVLQEFYHTHIDQFMEPERRSAVALTINGKNFEPRIEVTEAELRATYESRKDEFGVPERRSFEQLLLADERIARDLVAQAGSDEALAAVAARGASGHGVVRVGPVARPDLPPDLAIAVFDGEANAVRLAKTPLGWHIVRVLSVEPSSIAPFETVAPGLRDELRRERVSEMVIDLGNRVDEGVARGKTLEAIADELGLGLRKIDAIDVQGRDAAGAPLADVPPKMLETIFASVKDVPSSLIEATREELFVVRVDSIQPAAPRAFADIRASVLAAWQRDQKMSAARQQADEIVKQTATATSLQTAASAKGFAFATAGPFTRRESPSDTQVPVAVIRQFLAKPAGVAAAIPSERGIFVGLGRIEQAATTNSQGALQESDLASAETALDDDVLQQFLSSLRGRFPVRVNETALQARAE
jgi:peptidyl-prolyl cis-trans isomerase D